jgi:hypothetical protein
MSSEPEYLICLNCDTATYTFEWVKDKVASVICEVCGNDDPDEFMTEAEYEDTSPTS